MRNMGQGNRSLSIASDHIRNIIVTLASSVRSLFVVDHCSGGNPLHALYM